jgi:hypothetical protein
MTKAVWLLAILCLSHLPAFTQADDGRTITIRVIFHVLYSRDKPDNGIDSNSIEQGNSTENLPATKLLAELKNLHDDFLLLNSDTPAVLSIFKPFIANSRIEFVLADTVLQAGGEKGIIRIQTVRNRNALYKRSAIIDPQKYLNVYIGRLNSDGFVNSSKGAKYCDSWTYPYDDAVHLDYKWVGLSYRLLTHETGHWCGLWHIFEGGCNDPDGDDISDTPPQRASTNGICKYCPPTVPDQSCTAQASNYNNYMDYSGCRKMFTLEQVKRMRFVIQTFRSQIWSTSK